MEEVISLDRYGEPNIEGSESASSSQSRALILWLTLFSSGTLLVEL